MAAVRQVLSQLKNVFLSLSAGKRITLISLILGTVIGFALLMSWTGRINYQTLYSNLEPEGAGAILTRLKEQKVPYRISTNGRSILVPEDQIYELRMQLASEGLPQGGGIGFEVFDNTKLGMTEFAQNVNYQRALQGELARTINKIGEIESSRIHIVVPEKSLFIENEDAATASVVLKLRPGKWLTQGQVNGIVHLVSSSVARLSPDKVTVVDSTGKMLAGFDDKSSFGSVTLEQNDYQSKVEKNLERRIKTMLESALGDDKAIVRLSCDFDFQRQETTEERYLPENQVVRSEQSLSESSVQVEKTPIGVPGIRSNIPNPGPAQGGTTDTEAPTFEKKDRTVNYEIGKVTSHIMEPTGEMTRVSVAVMVDGSYELVEAEEGESEWKYVPRTPEEMEKLTNIVKRAVNFNAERGDQVEVANIPFESAKAFINGPKEKEGLLSYLNPYKSYIKYIFLGLFLLLSYLFFIKPLVRWLTENTVGDVEQLLQLPKTVGELESEFNQGVPSLTFVDQASQLISDDSATSVGVMRDWIQDRKDN